MLATSGRWSRIVRALAAVCAAAATTAAAGTPVYYDVAAGAHPHDVAAAPEPGGPVYYTAQRTGRLGIVDPKSRKVEEVDLGPRSSPHGVIVGPDGAPWITDSGQNAIVRVDPKTRAVKRWPLPEGSGYANLNTAAFDRKGRIWFTGQSGVYGRVDPATIDVETGAATVVEPPTPDQGARRIWSDSRGRLWVSYWNTGHVGMYDPAARAWREWKLPGNAHAYSVWVDPADRVWLTDWSTNAIVRFDPATERFASFPSNRGSANVRQMLGRAGEAWGAESGTDRLVMVPAP